MPTYEYLCPDCGPFTAFRPMAEFQDPQPCGCGDLAPRVTLSAPRLAGMDAGRRAAIATNERSANVPTRSAGHPAACGCCKPVASRTRTESANGAKSVASARPWMISH